MKKRSFASAPANYYFFVENVALAAKNGKI
jgi:hypothetical protein